MRARACTHAHLVPRLCVRLFQVTLVLTCESVQFVVRNLAFPTIADLLMIPSSCTRVPVCARVCVRACVCVCVCLSVCVCVKALC